MRLNPPLADCSRIYSGERRKIITENFKAACETGQFLVKSTFQPFN